MQFPIVAMLAVAAIVGGGVTLTRYSNLSAEEQEKADRLSCDYARRIYQKSLTELTEAEKSHVGELTQRHFEG